MALYSINDSAIFKGLASELVDALKIKFEAAEMHEVQEGTRVVFEEDDGFDNDSYILKNGVFVKEVDEETPKPTPKKPSAKKVSKAKGSDQEEEAPKPPAKKVPKAKGSDQEEEVPKPPAKKATKAKAAKVEEKVEVEKVETEDDKVEAEEKGEEKPETEKESDEDIPKPRAKKQKKAEADGEQEKKAVPKRQIKKVVAEKQPEPEEPPAEAPKKATRGLAFTLDELINAINTNKTAAAIKMVNRLKDKYGNDIMKMRKPKTKKTEGAAPDTPAATPRKRNPYIEFMATELPKVTAEGVPHAERMTVVAARWTERKEKLKNAATAEPMEESEIEEDEE